MSSPPEGGRSRSDFNPDFESDLESHSGDEGSVDFASAVKATREHIWLQIPLWFGMESFEGEPLKRV